MLFSCNFCYLVKIDFLSQFHRKVVHSIDTTVSLEDVLVVFLRHCMKKKKTVKFLLCDNKLKEITGLLEYCISGFFSRGINFRYIRE